MEYVNDINIMEAVVHVLDRNSDEPILNEYKVDLTDDVYRFMYKHIERCLKSEDLKYAVFNPEGYAVKEVSQEFLNGVNGDIIEVSQELARQLFYIMRANKDIPSFDLFTVSISTDQGPMLGILKLDYIKNFTHKVDLFENKIGIGIVEHQAGLPASGQKIQKCAFIKPLREENEVDIMVIDKIKRTSKDDEYGANWFINNYLGCTFVQNERDMTKTFLNAAETWTRNNIIEDAEKAEEIRTTIKTKLKEDDVINVNDLTEELFDDVNLSRDFIGYMNSYGLEDIKVDKVWAEKKLKRTRLKIDREIDLYIDDEVYNDNSKFEIIRNGDGSINIVLKNIRNYIEK
ncbi:37-kD nucleoid-associated bacterial protein [Clostridium perfringens]|uniref:nucleoid-associated protein n=1 Tax=Clostridium perfringens TaxID=1502 RepID=UPI002444B724|nr:nucleoid-associated protein [Clostridium perfringens]MDG6883617.1 37-kD nucleoid-associated bacterial protein [Clostridium perfringens]